MANSVSNYFKSIPNAIKNGVADIISNSDFVSRTIGMNDSYNDLMFIIQSLGHEPISLLGKDYMFIFDHVRRNYQQGTSVPSYMYGGGQTGCPKFTFYKEKPTVKFADPYFDTQNLLDRWMPDIKLNETKRDRTGLYYAESNDDEVNNKSIQNAEANFGVANGQVASSFSNLTSCDLVKKTNDGFNAGKYRTLIARFHTNSDDSRTQEDPTQTANTKKYGMSHGRNLLKYNPTKENGYNNPYCRVWTYHYQYNQMQRAIRPFKVAFSEDDLERIELLDNYGKGGFRTIESKNYGFDGGSKRLDKYGVMNYDNGFINIAPTAKIKDYFEHKEDDKDRRSISTKRCMFSIENLAWRDEKNKPDEFDAYGLSAEQKGPLGGRIMWFPPYDLTFNEDVKVKWNSNEFIGRGENIYTYTNTERTGNLSFTLLIDHPSILDYWTGHEKNGMSNGGDALSPGNDGGVDNVNNQENTLLRFFAGCDILTAKPQEYWTRSKTPEVVQDQPKQQPPQAPNPNPQKPDEAKPKKKKIYCFAFYPNNYSGKDDGSVVNPIHYLLNGIGTQKRVNEVTKDAEDFVVDMSKSVYSNIGTGYGGYEMRTGKGVSIATEVLQADYNVLKSTFSDLSSNERKAQYLTNGNGYSSAISAYYDGGEPVFNSPYLAKQVGKTAMSLGSAKDKNGNLTPSVTKSPYTWYRERWYYRVDNDTMTQKLVSKENYLDTKSYRYNSDGIYDSLFIKSEFGIDIDSDNDTVVSLTDMYMALEGGDKSKDLLNGLYKDEKVEIIKNLSDKNGTCKITKVTFYGHASSQGNNLSNAVNTTRNDSLSKNRALTLKKWLEKNNFPGLDNATIETKSSVQHGGDKNDVNDPITKFWRSASVVIEYEETDTEGAQTTDSSVQTDGSGNIVKDSDTNAPLNAVDKVSVTSKENSPGAINTARDWLYNTEEGKQILKTGYTETEYIRGIDGKITPIEVPKSVSPWNFTMADAARITGKDYLNTASTEYDDSYKQTDIVVGKSTVKRYDNEGEFFQLLERNAPFMHHLISEKIKYFDPAYHSISPEGFNARLTFLQQCTRQGPTVGNSDYNSKTAYNLAFGRPPVCVLRLGDFYYTKIIINSINIQYENAQWDLNPEGIGVMPMFAKVSMSFTFLGGSDLAGPISRLQNAVSFNYYANASVYDNRAERVLYDSNGEGREVKYRPFTYPNPYGTKKRTGEVGNQINENIDRDGVGLEDF